MREYQFDLSGKSTRVNNECFTEDDIVNIYPIVKQVPPKVCSIIVWKFLTSFLSFTAK